MANRRNNATNACPEAVPVQYKVLRVHPYKRTTFFDVEINGVFIYGCTIVDGQNGSFIGWPVRKSDDGRWYKHVYVPLTEDDLQGIIDAVDTFER